MDNISVVAGNYRSRNFGRIVRVVNGGIRIRFGLGLGRLVIGCVVGGRRLWMDKTLILTSCTALGASRCCSRIGTTLLYSRKNCTASKE